MHCGPIRYKVDAKQEAKKRNFEHYIVPRFTSTRMPLFKKQDEWRITEVYQHICESNYRNELIVADVVHVIDTGRNPLVLTERTSHIDQLVASMSEKDFEVIVLCIKTIEEYADKYRPYITEFINEIEGQGIQVIQVLKNHYKFMIIDNKIVWYGGIDILGGSYDENSLIRIEDEELANELIGVITELNLKLKERDLNE